MAKAPNLHTFSDEDLVDAPTMRRSVKDTPNAEYAAHLQNTNFPAQQAQAAPPVPPVPPAPAQQPVHPVDVAPEKRGNASRGHPHLCRRPCVRFSKGECKMGDACEYCHLEHKPLPTFDKRQRILLRDMDTGTLCAVLLPHIRLAMTNANIDGKEILETFETMARGSAFENHNREVQRLNGVFKKLPLAALILQIRREGQFGALYDQIERLRLDL